jgi:hypothetical protein
MKRLLRVALASALAAMCVVACGKKEAAPKAGPAMGKPGEAGKGGPPGMPDLGEMMKKMQEKATQMKK